jgi:hypothetical protein
MVHRACRALALLLVPLAACHLVLPFEGTSERDNGPVVLDSGSDSPTASGFDARFVTDAHQPDGIPPDVAPSIADLAGVPGCLDDPDPATLMLLPLDPRATALEYPSSVRGHIATFTPARLNVTPTAIDGPQSCGSAIHCKGDGYVLVPNSEDPSAHQRVPRSVPRATSASSGPSTSRVCESTGNSSTTWFSMTSTASPTGRCGRFRT